MSQEQQVPQQYVEDDEITLKELIEKIREFWQEAWKNKWWIILVAGLMASIFLLRAWFTPVTYPAALTFMVNEDNGGGLGGVSAILGQFGFGGGKKDGSYNLDKILELSKSRKIIQSTLFKKVTVNGEEDFFANHIIKLYELHEKWEDDTTGLKGFYFSRGVTDSFDRVEYNALKHVHAQVRGSEEVEGILSSSYNDDTGILSLSLNSYSEDLSIKFIDSLYHELSSFYIKNAVEPQQKTLNNISAKVDSLGKRLQSINYQLADFEDRSFGTIDQKSEVRKTRLLINQQVTGAAYGEAIKNLELADFTLKNATPAFQLIDAPIPPIKPVGESKLKAIVIGGFVGGFIALIFFIGRKIIRDAMQS